MRLCGGDKQQATYYGRVLEEIDELRRINGCARWLPEGVRYEGRGNHENHQCHSCQSRINAEGQDRSLQLLQGSTAQHDNGHQAGRSAMGLANDPETLQQKYDCYKNTRKV